MREQCEVHSHPPDRLSPEHDLNELIVEAVKELADYQRLTAEGKSARRTENAAKID